MKNIFKSLPMVIFLGAVLAAHGAEEPPAFQRVKNSVVLLTAEQKSADIGSMTVANVVVHGTGVLIDKYNRVMTSADTVQTANWVQATFANDKQISARVESSATQADVASLELENIPDGIEGAPLGDSDKIQNGDPVFIVSVSSNAAPQMIACRITRRWKPETKTGNSPHEDLFEIGSELSNHNAGAPLFNAKGEVVGIVSRDFSSVPNIPGKAFAVPANLAAKLTLKTAFIWTGLSGRVLSGPTAEHFNLPQKCGYLIERISETSPSAQLGLRGGNRPSLLDGRPILLGGDIVLAVDGISFTADDAANKIRAHLRQIVNGARIRVKIFRDGKVEEITSLFER